VLFIPGRCEFHAMAAQNGPKVRRAEPASGQRLARMGRILEMDFAGADSRNETLGFRASHRPQPSSGTITGVRSPYNSCAGGGAPARRGHSGFSGARRALAWRSGRGDCPATA
jgi:hypothetical protein